VTLLLPEIQPEKWRRYHFESKSRYFTVILQQDLFHECDTMLPIRVVAHYGMSPSMLLDEPTILNKERMEQ
jgi:hypothetical protein